MDTEALICRLQQDDHEAFKIVYQAYHARIYRFLQLYLHDSDEAQEVTQTFFIKVWDKRHKLSSTASLEGQLFTMVRNHAIDGLRKLSRKRNFVTRYQSKVKECDRSTEEAIDHMDLQEQLQAVVAELPKKRRQVFRLSREEGLSNREIAQQMSISVKTVESQMTKALKVIRFKLNSFLTILL